MKGRMMIRASAAVLLLALAVAAGCGRFGRSDAQIADEVRGKIYADSAITSRQVTVASQNGVVTLTGTVSTDAERDAAAADASRVDGVKTVVNNLTVAVAEANPAPPPSRTGPPPPPVSRRESARNMAASARAASITIPEGTSLQVRMIDSIDSETNKVGDRFRASLDEPVQVGDTVVIPKNADVQGRVVNAASAGHFAGRSEIALELSSVTFGGRTYQIRTDQYSREGSSRGKRTAVAVGGGAAVGAIIGGIAGGGKGAAIGAAAGAGTGTAVQGITKPQQIKVPSETLLEFKLKQPLSVPRR